jgi:multiple sugar transport system substrate-binding protein
MSIKNVLGRALFVVVAVALVAACAAPAATPAPAAPQIIQQTVEVPVPQTVVVPVQQTVQVPVQQTVIVPQTAVPVQKTVVTILYGRFFKMSFSSAPDPLTMIKTAVEKQYPDIEVQLMMAPDDMNAWHDELSVWITAKDPTVDLIGLDSSWVSEFGAAGWAVPLNDKLPNLSDTFDQSGLNVWSYNGKQLAVPFWGATNGLYYRADLLKDAGVQPPQTWDDLVADVKAVQAKNPKMEGYLFAGGKSENLMMVWSEFLYAFGGKYVDDQGKCAFNSPEGIKAVEYMKSLIDTGIAPKSVTTVQNVQDIETAFAAGNAVFLRDASSTLTWLNDPTKSQIVGKWEFMQNPAQPGGVHAGSSGGFGMAMLPTSQHQDAALKVLQVVAGAEVQKGFALAWGPVQWYKGVYDDPVVKAAYPEMYRLANVLPSSIIRPQSKDYAQLTSIIQDQISAAITGVTPVKQALDSACQQYAALP